MGGLSPPVFAYCSYLPFSPLRIGEIGMLVDSSSWPCRVESLGFLMSISGCLDLDGSCFTAREDFTLPLSIE